MNTSYKNSICNSLFSKTDFIGNIMIIRVVSSQMGFVGIVNPCGAEIGIFREEWVDITTVDVVAACTTQSSSQMAMHT